MYVPLSMFILWSWIALVECGPYTIQSHGAIFVGERVWSIDIEKQIPDKHFLPLY